jgi:hypothetical protein
MQPMPGKRKETNGRMLEDLNSLRPAPRTGEPGQSSPPGALLEAYKKHVEELRGIEDRQQKVIALILGIFSAAATLLIEKGASIERPAKLYITILALIIVFIGRHAIHELHDLRVATRDLLVRCEIALRFYEVDAFLKGRMLYTSYELDFPKRGKWMKENYWIVLSVCVGFLVLLWFGKEIANAIPLPRTGNMYD